MTIITPGDPVQDAVLRIVLDHTSDLREATAILMGAVGRLLDPIYGEQRSVALLRTILDEASKIAQPGSPGSA